MNESRRKRINDVVEKLKESIDILQNISSEEEKSYNNLPDGIRDSERGDHMQECIELLQEAMDDIECAQEKLEEIV